MRRLIIAAIILGSLLVLAGCKGCPKSCDDTLYCTQDFCSKATEYTCKHRPIVNCNEKLARAEAECTGAVPGSTMLKNSWDASTRECITDVRANRQELRAFTTEASSGGDRFTIKSLFNNPFNLKKDTFDVRISFKTASANTADHKINRLSLSGKTEDKRTITIAEQDLNARPLFKGGEIFETLRLDVPETGIEGRLTDLTLAIDYDYIAITGTRRAQKSASFKTKYRNEKLVWVRPSTTYPCRECQERAGHTSECGTHTDFFCEYYPVAGACGNFVCDSGENTCTCPTDCGPCAGGTAHLEFSCVDNTCLKRIRGGTSPTAYSDFDNRKIGPIQLENNYEYVTPFDIRTDRIVAKFLLASKPEDVSRVRIEKIRVMVGPQQLAVAEPNVFLPPRGTETVSIQIPPSALNAPEEEKAAMLSVWYSYKRGEKQERGSYSKALRNTIAFLNPDA